MTLSPQHLGRVDYLPTYAAMQAFTAERLAAFDVVVWLSTSGDVLDDAGRRDFAAWLAAGGPGMVW